MSDTNRPRLPDEIETMELAQRRYPDAIKRLWDIDVPDFDVHNGPGKRREHVFDLDNGLRFIVSRERTREIDNGKPHVHVSVSFREGSAVEQVVTGCKSKRRARAAYMRIVRGSFAELSGLKLPEQMGITSGGILHWWLADVEA